MRLTPIPGSADYSEVNACNSPGMLTRGYNFFPCQQGNSPGYRAATVRSSYVKPTLATVISSVRKVLCSFMRMKPSICTNEALFSSSDLGRLTTVNHSGTGGQQ